MVYFLPYDSYIAASILGATASLGLDGGQAHQCRFDRHNFLLGLKAMMLDTGYERFQKAAAALDELGKDAAAAIRLTAATEEFDGLMLSGAEADVRQAIEVFGVRYSRSWQAAIKAKGEETASLSDEDANELAGLLRTTCELICSSESERILGALREHQGRLPEDEIDLIRKHLDWFTPLLLQECVAQTEAVAESEDVDRDSDSVEDSSIPFFSLYLASELDLGDFLPVVLRGLRLPGEGPFELYGDAIHELGSRYLAQFLSDNLDQIDELVLAASHNVYVRWTAAGSYKYLVRDKVLTLENAVARLDHLFEATKVSDEAGRPTANHPYEVSAGIVEAIAELGGGAISKLGDAPEQWRFVDTSIISLDEFLASSAAGDANGVAGELDSLPPTRVQDCLQELAGWAAFREVDRSFKQRPLTPRPSARPTPRLRDNLSQPGPKSESAARSDRTPRNAACPCGSGKKYKKCCLRA